MNQRKLYREEIVVSEGGSLWSYCTLKSTNAILPSFRHNAVSDIFDFTITLFMLLREAYSGDFCLCGDDRILALAGSAL